ncbi:MAG: hypothetical protein MJA83_04625 [Gammaproteobacteria bacterium]|nr:hypothetical protein [Gammaproteobacteria bacterium]
MKRLMLAFLGCLSLFAAGCTTSSEKSLQPASAPIDAPGQFGAIKIGRDNFVLSKEVVDIVDEESELDITGKDTRVKCTRRYRTGSHRIIRVCRTVAEIEQDSRHTRNEVERMYRQGKTRSDNH